MRVKKVIYSTICLLLVGLYLSCTGEKLDDGGTSPTIDYNLLRISSFSVVDGNENPINDTNAIPVDVSFLLTFDQSLGAMADYINHLKSQIKFINMEGSLIDLNVEPTQITNQVKIVPTTDLSYGTTYQLIVKEGLTIGDYRVIDDIVYPIATEKNSDSSLVVIYDSKEIFPNKNYITILLVGSDPGSVMFTLEVGEGATLQNGNDDLRLDKNNQYTTNMDFSSRATHSFIVTAQDGSTPITYIIGVSQKQADSKEILSFIFLERDHTHLKANIVMDVNTNNRTITKTVTNVEKITGLIPYIFHSGSNISPASRVAQDFSTNNTYTVTAIDKTTSSYTVTLTSYYGITFDANGGLIGGNPIADEYILYGKKVSPPSDPFLEHYGFKGWYDAPIDGNIFDFDTPVTTQTIVYAQWTNKQYQVRFYQGANSQDTVLATSLTVIPASDYPTPSTAKQLYKWYSDSGLTKVYDKDSLVVGNLDLYAKVLTTDGTFKSIIENEVTPFDLANYDDMSELIFSNYIAGADVIARYVKETGTGDGSSWANASGDIQAVIGGIGDANENRVYVVLIASGVYKQDTYIMTNHVTLVGGFTAGSYDQSGETHLDGDNDKRVFYNYNLDRTALLYGVVIINGNYRTFGGGMFNRKSSPTLINVTFSGNTAYSGGGGMVNWDASSPTLINVAFSGNTSTSGLGGGMINYKSSSPTLINVTFSNNTANNGNGGGMYNLSTSYPTLINVIFSDNEAASGGGIYSDNSGPTLINVTFSGNKANNGNGGGMYNKYIYTTLDNVIFSGNKANSGRGGGIYSDLSAPNLNNVTFSNNTADNGGGMYNRFSPSLLKNVTFSGNTARNGGGGILNYSSATTLINVTFSGNKANSGRGGGMHNWSSLPVLINVIFSGNTAHGAGGGIFHDDNAFYDKSTTSITLINTILWNNNNGNIYLHNDNPNIIETVNLYHSLIERDAVPSTTAIGIRLESGDTNTYPISINSERIIDSALTLGALADYGGKIDTISIGNNSPAKDKGIYVRGVKVGRVYVSTNLYYSTDNSTWYDDPGLTNPVANLPSDADDLTITDARGYGRVGRPDMGAYEVDGIEP